MKKKIQATGKRKTAIAKIVLTPKVNPDATVMLKSTNVAKSVTPEAFFPGDVLVKKVYQAFFVTQTQNLYDVDIVVKGGGFSSQADAIRHGISKALAEIKQEYRNLLKSAKLLTRDSRFKERKKYGLKKARKAPQFSKR